MLTNLKSRLMGHVGRALNLVTKLKTGVTKLKTEHERKPYTPPWLARLQHKYLRTVQCAPTGCPVLKGARLYRTIIACSPKHLTAWPRYMIAQAFRDQLLRGAE